MEPYPDFGVAYIKPNKKLIIKLEPSIFSETVEEKNFGEYIIYEKIILNENRTWGMFLGIHGYSYFEITNDLISITSIPDGEYIIESLINEDLILSQSKTFSHYKGLKKEESIYFYFKFDPSDNCYEISKNNVYLRDINLSNLDHNQNHICQKWRIYPINLTENVYRIESKNFHNNLTVGENNKLILSNFNGLINQQFYLWGKQKKKELIIKYPLIQLTNKLIKRYKDITKLEIDYNIKYIDDNAKSLVIKEINCEKKWLSKFNKKNFQNIIIKEGEKNININDFSECVNLLMIQLPKSLQNIEENSFKNCLYCNKIKGDLKWYKYFNIEEITLNNEKIAKKEVFANWTKIKKVVLSNNVEYIEEGAFENCGIEEITLSNKIKKIPHLAFRNCKLLKKIIIPDSVIDISPTAFSFCPLLRDVQCKDKLKKYFNKKLVIDKDNIEWKNYLDYLSIEYLKIPSEYNFRSDEDAYYFFKNLQNLNKLSIDPKYYGLIDMKQIKKISIPKNIKILEENTFENCDSLEYLKIKEIIYIKLKTQHIPNLSVLNVPQEIYYFNLDTLREFKKLKTIICSEKAFSFGTKYIIKEGIKVLNFPDIVKIRNLSYLQIPKSVQDIEFSDIDISVHLTCVNCDPKWIPFLPVYQLKKVIIPNFVKEINEENFVNGKNINEIIIQGEPTLKGNSNIYFENILYFKCFPSILTNASNNFKSSSKIITINEGCEIIKKSAFKNFTGLKKIIFPSTLKIIEGFAFENCVNLEEIDIPNSVNFVDITCFIGCSKIHTIKCKSDFFNCFKEKKNIKKITITQGSVYINPEVIKQFINVEILELPESIKNKDFNLTDLKHLEKIKCSEDFLKNLNKEEKINLLRIELIGTNKNIIDNKILEGCQNIQEVMIKSSGKILSEPKPHKTTMEDIIKFDNDNIFYKDYVENILKDLETGNARNYPDEDLLGQISNKITNVCLKIKKHTNGKLSPFLVQCFAIIKIIYKILTGKGALAEVKTGEGKSYIIAVIAIVLAQFNRQIDIVTSNLQLAFRDEKEQSEYYKLFEINSGVLFSKSKDEEYIKIYKPDYMKINTEVDFFTHVLSYPIVYSTNFNFEFLELHSYFRSSTLRKRKYDVVIIDEVDNMLLDQLANPAIVGYTLKLFYLEQILREIYNFSDYKEEIILDELTRKFGNMGNFDLDIITKLKQSARVAKQKENEVDYIIEKLKRVILDQTTGYKKPKQRWEFYIHEMIELKENLKIEAPIKSYCSISQNIFFNKYEKIGGLTGTLGSPHDQKLLKENYNIEIFKVPRNISRFKPIYLKQRPFNNNVLYKILKEEIDKESLKGRPVLVIMDSVKHVNKFIKLYPGNYGTICGIDLQEDNKSFLYSGNIGRVTISTSAAGRGMNIKPQKETLDIGGLHVILPFCMANNRSEEQAIGRSGRQGQPGSATIYRSEDDSYLETPEFNPKYNVLINLLNRFINHIRDSWNWIYKGKGLIGKDLTYKFNCTVTDVLKAHSEFILKPCLISYAKGNKNAFIGAVMFTIKISWSILFNYIDSHYKDNINIEEEYNKYLNKLYEYIPKNFSMSQCFNHLVDKLHMRRIIEDILHPKPRRINNISRMNKHFKALNNSNAENIEYRWIVVCEDLIQDVDIFREIIRIFSHGINPLLGFFTDVLKNMDVENKQLTHTGLIIGDTCIEFGTGSDTDQDITVKVLKGETVRGKVEIGNKHNWNEEKFGKFLNGTTNISAHELKKRADESGQWEKYNLFSHNCQDFVKFCLEEMGIEEGLEKFNCLVTPFRDILK